MKMQSVVYCGLHYQSCPVSVREFWARICQGEEGLNALHQNFRESLNQTHLELVLISTCNRFDLCIFADAPPERILFTFAAMARNALAADESLLPLELKKQVTEPLQLQKLMRFFSDEAAIKQLFRVASSLDSLVLGEPHILGQIKDAFAESQKCQTSATQAQTLFNHCFQVAKRVRTETDLGRNGISVGHAAVDVTRRIYSDLSSCAALVLGSGEMARIVAQHFESCGVKTLSIANRTFAKAEQLAKQCNRANALTLDQGLQELTAFDVVVVATSSPTPLVQTKHILNLKKRKKGSGPLVIVDICVPRNVDPQVSKGDNVFVFDIDDLDQIMESNRIARRSAAQLAETIIETDLAIFLQNLRLRQNLANVGQFHQFISEIVESELIRNQKISNTRNSKITNHLKTHVEIQPQIQSEIQPQTQHQSNDEFKSIAAAIAKKIIAHPAHLARTDARPEGALDSGALLSYLFNLNSSEAGK